MNYFSFLAVSVVFCVNLAYISGQAPQKSCGGTIGLTHLGTKTSQNYPDDNGDGTVCKWVFNNTKPVAKYVYVVVETLGLITGDSFLVTDQDKQLEIPENYEIPFAFAVTTTGSNLTFQSGSLPPKPDNPRRISFNYYPNDNPIILNAHRGVIESPLYVPSVNSSISLSWILAGTTEHKIAFAFKRFNTSSGVLNVTENNVTTRTFTGSEVPTDFLAVNANVKLDLWLPIDDSNLGFQLFYTEVVDSCSQEVTVNDTTNVVLDVSKTTLKGNCVWLLKGPENMILSATVSSIESSENISVGLLSFHDGGSVFSKSLGLLDAASLIKDVTMLTSQNMLRIAYTYQDSSVPNITITVRVHNNGATLKGSGPFGVPHSASNMTLLSNSSMWALVADTNKRVRVDVKSISLTGNERIVFHDGNCIDNENILFAFDANSTGVIPIVSSKSEMFVVAENLSVNAAFNAVFTSVSGGDFVLSSTNFGSHQIASLESKSNSTWIIKPNVNDTTDVINLMFNMLVINSTTSSFVIYEGVTNAGTLLANVTHTTLDLAIFINAAKGALIVYDNLGPNAVSGNLLDAFYTVLPRCIWNVNVTEEKVLTSPLYPRSYPINTDCTVNLTAAQNKTLLLSFEDVDLMNNHTVTVLNNNTSVMNLTGTITPDDYISNGSSLLVKFLAKSLPTNLTAGRGYRIRVVPLDCGGHLTDAKNAMNTPNYPNLLKNTTVCVWSIELPKEKEVEIISLTIESKPVAASPANLSFIDGGSLHSSSSEEINPSTTSYLSRTGKLMIVYNYTQNLKVDGNAFKFTYTSQACSLTQLCKNGICMHDSWKCNGINDCGDFSDEFNCTSSSPIIDNSGVGVATFVLMLFLMFFTGVAVALAAPHLWRRMRSPRHYQSFGGPVDA